MCQLWLSVSGGKRVHEVCDTAPHTVFETSCDWKLVIVMETLTIVEHRYDYDFWWSSAVKDPNVTLTTVFHREINLNYNY